MEEELAVDAAIVFDPESMSHKFDLLPDFMCEQTLKQEHVNHSAAY